MSFPARVSEDPALDILQRLETKLDHVLEDRSKVTELWLDKKGLAEELGMSVRWIEQRMENKKNPIPHRSYHGAYDLRPSYRFRLSEVEAWLRKNGLMREVS